MTMNISQAQPEIIYRKDYIAPDYWVDTVDLQFDIQDDATLVSSRLVMRRAETATPKTPVVLQGRDMVLMAVHLDGRLLNATEYQVTEEQLEIFSVHERFILEIEVKIKPHENTSLEGLYYADNLFCTQCESNGFSKIIYFPDRPDVMSMYRTTIIADKKRFPVLLSNGNCVEFKELENGRHSVTWEDPFKKPCYLFALVAGDLACVTDNFATSSGRNVALKIFVEKGNENKCDHAMQSLKKAMRWDEYFYGREYDLNIFMIVAVRSFNMGAMENKGLNIFNSKYILAEPQTATDQDYMGIESVVAHEYFHNWTGNRVTCRDWFQLSLKEGLTVFRDQSFSADQGSASVERIDHVRQLRATQFLEDAGPLAHPVRPDAYIEMNNFYTSTVYEKGAEVIRMMHTLLTPVGFRRGMDLYFERHDGQAVTCDDFVKAMEDANKVDFTQFRRWYSQAGTPQLTVSSDYDAENERLMLTVTQNTPSTPGQPHKEPLHIPLAMGLLTKEGYELPVELLGEAFPKIAATRVLEIKKPVEVFEFVNIPQQPIVSLLRGFSAPVKLISDETDHDRLLRFAHDTDAFARWDAGQELLVQHMLRWVEAYQQELPLVFDKDYINALHQMLHDHSLDNAFKARLLAIPTESYLGDLMSAIDVGAICAVRKFAREQISQQLKSEFQIFYDRCNKNKPYEFTTQDVADRSLKNMCLHYIAPISISVCISQLNNADNMTDALAALQNLANIDTPEREPALQAFYQKWQHEPLVIDKWFSIQVMSELPNRLEKVRELMQHPGFSIKNPNQVRAVIGAFCSGNFQQFHAINGEGYTFLAEQILELNKLNPQIASRLLTPLTRWRRYAEPRQKLMRQALETIAKSPDLSKDVYEIVTKSLG
jgi:aminopeptidase N